MQNRIVNASFLIPSKSVTKILVSCVEQGRWGNRGKVFRRSPHHAAHAIRKLNVMHHKETLKARQGYRSDQGRVWEAVACLSHEMAAPTPTGAMHDVYERKKSSFEEYVKKNRPVRGQTGAAFLLREVYARRRRRGLALRGEVLPGKGALFQRGHHPLLRVREEGA